jgi:NAD(P)-dependent dehydrogenase (short-subunit alcohol dehydrogenase family)
MDYRLQDRVVVLTGGGSGIGLATTRLFLREGANVLAGDLDTQRLKELESEGAGRIVPIEVDLSTADGCQALVQGAVDEFGRLDVLINNVGIFPYRDGFLATSDEDWDHLLNLNFMSYVRCSRAAIPHMLEAGKGSIVHIASEDGRQPDIFLPDYSVSKAAVLMLSKILADEFGPTVRSNVVSPGPTRTPQWDVPGGFAESLAQKFGFDDKEEAIRHFATTVRGLPMGRLGDPDDPAHVVLFLASDLSKQVTGSDYGVNGGSIKAA